MEQMHFLCFQNLNNGSENEFTMKMFSSPALYSQDERSPTPGKQGSGGPLSLPHTPGGITKEIKGQARPRVYRAGDGGSWDKREGGPSAPKSHSAIQDRLDTLPGSR